MNTVTEVKSWSTIHMKSPKYWSLILYDMNMFLTLQLFCKNSQKKTPAINRVDTPDPNSYWQ